VFLINYQPKGYAVYLRLKQLNGYIFKNDFP